MQVERFIILLCLCAAVPAVAQEAAPPTESPDQRKSAFDAAVKAAEAAEVNGPSDIKLGDKGTLHLPAGASWVPKAQADRFLQASGHRSNPDLMGLISGSTDKHGWLAIVDFTDEGHIKDDDAKDLDPAKVLADLRDGAEEENKDRAARGFSPLVLDDWLQPPKYDPINKWLVWALPVHTVDDADVTINYNTRALGREGYFSLNLLTDKQHFEAEKGEAATLLKGITYNPGHRYIDFNPSTDRVAAYGLAALIGAVAIKKLGLLALATAFVLKFAKLGALALIGAFVAVKRFFTGRKKGDPTA